MKVDLAVEALMKVNWTWRHGVLIGLVGAGCIAPWFFERVPQDVHYHAFADTAAYVGIPNFLNVTTNIFFILVGVFGLAASRAKGFVLDSTDRRMAYHVFFVGVILVGLGSAYYHVNPNTDTLVWDRLPMTVSFMALVAMIVSDCLSPKIGKAALWPLVGMGVGSVGYWHITESWGVGDLRPYGVVQFLPMALIPVMLGLFGTRRLRSPYVWAMLVTYGLAKIAEHFDGEIYSLGGIISGHSLKHVLAALATAWVMVACRSRDSTRWDSSKTRIVNGAG